jgi:hypothetical protein
MKKTKSTNSTNTNSTKSTNSTNTNTTNSRTISDFKIPIKKDGTKDNRYSTAQFVKKDGTRDMRTINTNNR